ncbi:TPA: alpha-mannosidase, partial [Candidatus Bipolaricaulota bacterium]|nr:alpha-mannosidase [Candidatus Bipolaricaulota bacterium]
MRACCANMGMGREKGREEKEKDKEGIYYLVGHAHIDAAWLWTREETIRVCHDTFSSVLKLMRSYPEFRFVQSSAQYYEWMEERYPELFMRIKERIKEGRWEVVGGMWVEPDCNLPSGESLVRQLLYGKRYLKEKLGVDVQVAWLPDTFGFPWTLPQLLVKAGIRYFLTAKLNYKASLPFPYNVFWWVAPDGSRVLACQTVGGYAEHEEALAPEALARKLLQLRRRHGIDELLVVYGKGDHGGGPTEEMLERARRLNLSSRERRSPPRIVFSTAEGYFKRLEEMASSSPKEIQLPQVEDELYLKTHRGTYTTQAKVKRNNRRAEHLLEAAEKFSTIAWALGMSGCGYGYGYPREGLHRAWKKLLFNQFHDILAGSAIPQVYEDAERDFQEIFEVAEGALRGALK